MINKKHGFTLGETLIALGIIGVLAAILLPFALKAKPDDNKVLYLKAYDSITKQVHKLASNTSLFAFSSNWDDSNEAQIDCERLPFLNDYKPIKSGDYTKDNNGKYSGETKFCNLLAEAMGVNNPSCNDEVYSFNSANSADFNSKFNSNITFTTKNGMQWYVTQPTKRDVDQDKKKATYQKDIYVDINGSKGPNCIYKATSCEKPDRFKFELFADGELIPADPMGKLYIKERHSFLKKDTIAEGTVNEGINRKAVKKISFYKKGENNEEEITNGDIEIIITGAQQDPRTLSVEASGDADVNNVYVSTMNTDKLVKWSNHAIVNAGDSINGVAYIEGGVSSATHTFNNDHNSSEPIYWSETIKVKNKKLTINFTFVCQQSGGSEEEKEGEEAKKCIDNGFWWGNYHSAFSATEVLPPKNNAACYKYCYQIFSYKNYDPTWGYREKKLHFNPEKSICGKQNDYTHYYDINHSQLYNEYIETNPGHFIVYGGDRPYLKKSPQDEDWYDFYLTNKKWNSVNDVINDIYSDQQGTYAFGAQTWHYDTTSYPPPKE